MPFTCFLLLLDAAASKVERWLLLFLAASRVLHRAERMPLGLLLLALGLVWPSTAHALDALESETGSSETSRSSAEERRLNQTGSSETLRPSAEEPRLNRTGSSESLRSYPEELRMNRTGSWGGEIRIYQWNPHWQCFYSNDCKGRAKWLINHGLRNMQIDFGNVIELVDDSYQPPAGFDMLKSTCNSKENALLIYDSSKWRPSSKGGSRASGCITHRDRAFNVQMFESVSGYPLSQVVVVGAHYPHSINVPRLRQSLAGVIYSTGVENTIFIGDTNQEEGDSRDVARALGMPRAHAVGSSPLFVSCCHKVNEGFVWKFDRIISNFGEVVGARVFEVPSWATKSMHRAVHAKIRLS